MSVELLPPVAPSLPTFTQLGAVPPQDPDADSIGRTWIAHFAHLLDERNISLLISLLHAEPWWRDIFALTWDLRTFQGRDKIATFLHDRLNETSFGKVVFVKAAHQTVAPDLAWILVYFSFETAVGLGRGITRLVYVKGGAWRAVTVSTQLESLKGHPEQSVATRDFRMNTGNWAEERKAYLQFADHDPEVLVIGGGQSGLEVAARLKHFGVSHLVVEKNDRLGDNWRTRYDSLSLHDPICAYFLCSGRHGY